MTLRDAPDLDELEESAPEADAPREVPPGKDAPREVRPAKDAPEQNRPKVPDDPDDPRTPSECRADLRQQADGGWKPQKFDAPREELAKFNPERANLRPMTPEQADQYIAEHRDSRPWLAMTDKASPEARVIIAVLDAAGGHAHIRHEGWVTEEANERRAAYREDPAQLDPEKRAQGIDGLRSGDQPHSCRTTATRITDPDAFAAAFARGVEHPKFQEALRAALESGKRPKEVTIPIADLLGPDGYRYCTGWRLDSGDKSMKSAVEDRELWISKKAAGGGAEIPQPQAKPVPSFKNGEIVFAFTRNDDTGRLEAVTLFPRPAQQ